MEVRDVRNIRQARVDLAPGLNVFQGRNAQGKTSLLEAIYYLATGQSHHATSDRQLINFLTLPLELAIIPALMLLAILVGIWPAISAYRTDVAKSLGK